MTTTVRLMLVPPATTDALREARFDAEVTLDASGTRGARAARGALPRFDAAVSGPSLRCRETARELGLTARTAVLLADWDVGRWRGLTLEEVGRAEPEEVGRWLADPSAAPHGGESLTELCVRAGEFLDSLTPDTGRLLAIVDPAPARALLVRALQLPPEAFWRLDLAPLSLTELTSRGARWNLRCGTLLTGPL